MNNIESLIRSIVTVCDMMDIGTPAKIAGADHIIRIMEQHMDFDAQELREDLGLDFNSKSDGSADDAGDVAIRVDKLSVESANIGDASSVTIRADKLSIQGDLGFGQSPEAETLCKVDLAKYTPEQLKMASELLLDMISKSVAS